MFVLHPLLSQLRTKTPQSEEDIQLKNELEMLVERLRVWPNRYVLGSH